MKINPKIFKDYDIRGIYPSELDAKTAYLIGRAYANFLQTKEIAIGRDMRISSELIFQNLQRGIREGGTNVVDLGMVSTDMVYFAVGKYNYGGGIMITASHNPSNYNGFKFCREKALPVSGERGLFQIRDEILKGKYDKEIADPLMQGKMEKQDIMKEWLAHGLSFIDPGQLKPLKIVVDAGNGMAGKVIPELSALVPFKVIPLYFELDGHFLNHEPNPLLPEALEDLKREILEQKADLGMIFDGDADRVFMLDEKGDLLPGTIMTALIAESILKKKAGQTVLYNAICGWIVPETIEKFQGIGIKTRVGHSLIKAEMQRTNAIFAGEHSGHYYFRANFGADSALIAALIVLEIISKEGKLLSDIRKKYDKYFSSGEINTKVLNIKKLLTLAEKEFSNAEKIEKLDGLSVHYKDYWFNLRPSNTEPLLRLNLEARGPELMEQKRDEVLKFVREEAKKQEDEEEKKGPPKLFEV